MQSRIIKYYYNYSTNDPMKDYQKQGRSRVYALKRISSVTVTARANTKHCILGIHYIIFIKMLSCILSDKQVFCLHSIFVFLLISADRI